MNDIAKQTKEKVARFRPATDIIEREDGFYIYMDIPGVRKENVIIDLREDELVITGRTSFDFGGGENFTEMQFGDCEYVRSVAISDLIDREAIKANCENGVLELHLPKAEKMQPRRIEIISG